MDPLITRSPPPPVPLLSLKRYYKVETVDQTVGPRSPTRGRYCLARRGLNVSRYRDSGAVKQGDSDNGKFDKAGICRVLRPWWRRSFVPRMLDGWQRLIVTWFLCVWYAQPPCLFLTCLRGWVRLTSLLGRVCCGRGKSFRYSFLSGADNVNCFFTLRDWIN